MTALTVWKFDLELVTEQALRAPGPLRPLRVAVQHGVPRLWALVAPGEAEPVERTIVLVGTGFAEVDPGDEYLGTLLLNGDNLVLHVFSRVARPAAPPDDDDTPLDERIRNGL